jgi:hypothetical protein
MIPDMSITELESWEEDDMEVLRVVETRVRRRFSGQRKGVYGLGQPLSTLRPDSSKIPFLPRTGMPTLERSAG